MCQKNEGKRVLLCPSHSSFYKIHSLCYPFMAEQSGTDSQAHTDKNSIPVIAYSITLEMEIEIQKNKSPRNALNLEI